MAVGTAAVSHRDLVSIMPYSSVGITTEPDDGITAHVDARHRPPTKRADKPTSSLERHDAIVALISCLDHTPWPDSGEGLVLADEQCSPGSLHCCMSASVTVHVFGVVAHCDWLVGCHPPSAAQ